VCNSPILQIPNAPPAGGNAPNVGAAGPAPGPHRSGNVQFNSVIYLDEDGTNYNSWKLRLQWVLRNRRIWNVVTGTLIKPDENVDLPGYTSWIEKDEEAFCHILMSLKDDSTHYVEKATSSKEAWDALSARYNSRGEERVVELITQIFRGTFSESEPLEPQIKAITKAARSLEELGTTFNDATLAVALITSLPASLSTLKIILSQTSSNQLTPAYVTEKVRLDERRRINESGESHTAFFAKAGKKGQDKGKGREDNQKRCNYCKYFGHDKSECRKLKDKKAKDGNASKSSTSRSTPASTAKIAVVDSDAEGDTSGATLFLASTLSLPPLSPLAPVERVRANMAHAALKAQPDLQQLWIIDSGASRTMCSNRHWFQHFTQLQRPIEVTLGDNSTIPSTGMGRIAVTMRTDGHEHHAVLQDVLYVPDLHGNLLSIAHLTSRGADIRFVGTDCIIHDKKDGNPLCGGSRRGANLYIMDMEADRPAIARHRHGSG
jgi:hypothetical protein